MGQAQQRLLQIVLDRLRVEQWRRGGEVVGGESRLTEPLPPPSSANVFGSRPLTPAEESEAGLGGLLGTGLDRGGLVPLWAEVFKLASICTVLVFQ